jgi:TetR/AcrR family transcriptional repressor of lmrAB and yxaGH operons
MAPRGKTRERIIDTAVDRFRHQGYDGTGLNEILERSGAPRGSLYFHFPGGKEELGSAAVEKYGTSVGAAIEQLLTSTDDLAEGVARVVELMADGFERSDGRAGCAVAAVTLDAASESEPLRGACEASFELWLSRLERRLLAAGREPGEASDDAVLILAAIEGGLVLARARRDAEPLRAVARRLRRTLAA